MFNHAELWGMRREGTNPCLRVKRFQERRRERLLTDGEVSAIYTALEASEAAGFEHWSTIHPRHSVAVRDRVPGERDPRAAMAPGWPARRRSYC